MSEKYKHLKKYLDKKEMQPKSRKKEVIDKYKDKKKNKKLTIEERVTRIEEYLDIEIKE